MDPQGDLNFHTGDSAGYEAFKKNRLDEIQRVARSLGLPVGQFVAVRLHDGRELSGRLLAVEDPSFLESSRPPTVKLKVDGVVFPASEVASCIVI